MYKVPAQALRKSQKVERLYETKCKLSAKSARYFEQHFGYLPMVNTNIEKFYMPHYITLVWTDQRLTG